jgi:hypothetical protein
MKGSGMNSIRNAKPGRRTLRTDGTPYLSPRYEPKMGRRIVRWEQHGLIWRTLATYSEVLGRTPCRSSSPRRHFYRVFLAVQFLDMHGHAAAACKLIEQIGDDLLRCFLRRRIPRMA